MSTRLNRRKPSQPGRMQDMLHDRWDSRSQRLRLVPEQLTSRSEAKQSNEDGPATSLRKPTHIVLLLIQWRDTQRDLALEGRAVLSTTFAAQVHAVFETLPGIVSRLHDDAGLQFSHSLSLFCG